MRRTVVLIALVVLSATLATDAAAAGGSTPPPRDVLTSTEYQELVATAKAEKSPGHGAVTQIAHRECRALNNVSRLTTTQHAECQASFVFYVRFVGYTTALVRCAKDSTKIIALRCVERMTQNLDTSTGRFLKTDSASRRAAVARGFSGKCLNYLILTPLQKHATKSLGPGLHGYARALTIGNQFRLVSASKRLGADIELAQKAMLVSAKVTVCRHD